MELRPEAGERAVLLIATDELPGRSFVRRIDARGQLGSVRACSRRPLASWGAPTPMLVTSDGKRVCLEPLEPAPVSELRCVAADPLGMAPLGDGLALIEELPEMDQERGQEGSRGARPAQATGSRDSDPAPTRMGLRLVPMTGPIPTEATDTGLEVRWPMSGMDLVDAVPTGDGIALAWYEHVRFVGRGRARAEAELRAGLLDASGTYRRSSRVRLFGGTREYGAIEGHLDPRLVARGGRAAFVGRTVERQGRGKRFGYEARTIDPDRKLDPSAALCRIDPAALARPSPAEESYLAWLEELAKRQPELAAGQPRSDIGRVAWANDRGYFISDDDLWSVDRPGGKPIALEWPFVGMRARLRAAAIDRRGNAIARTTSHVAWLTADGRLGERALERGAPGSSASDPSLPAEGEGLARWPAVFVGSTWWVLEPRPEPGRSRWQLRSLLPPERSIPHATGERPDSDAVSPAASVERQVGALGSARTGTTVDFAPGQGALVGGPSRGLLIRVYFDAHRAARLAVDALGADGRLARLATHASPIASGVVAVERSEGGAIVAGRAPDEAASVVALALDGNGALLRSGRVEIDLGGPSEPLELSALPPRGAALVARGGSRVVWLDDAGLAVESADWPAERARATCLDGRPARAWVPTPEPGLVARVDWLARAGTCVTAGPQWAPDGTLRWVGARSTGMDSLAELVVSRPSPSVGSVPVETNTVAAEPASVASSFASDAADSDPRAAALPPCPPDMVYVPQGFCIDRFEARLVDVATGLPLSPDWPGTPGLTRAVVTAWSTGRWRAGDVHGRSLPLPPLLRAVASSPSFAATNEPGVRPSGYVTGLTADEACRTAGKRLCKEEEFRTACRGQEDRKFPYGAEYEQGACNVFRDTHPASVLHGNAAIGHLDPRLNRVVDGDGPLLHRTGTTPRCRSRWGDDFVYDLVGNLDEWIDETKGAFAGGFYARSTRSGCDALITAHPRRYLDYSTGFRCCLGAERSDGAPSQHRDPATAADR